MENYFLDLHHNCASVSLFTDSFLNDFWISPNPIEVFKDLKIFFCFDAGLQMTNVCLCGIAYRAYAVMTILILLYRKSYRSYSIVLLKAPIVFHIGLLQGEECKSFLCRHWFVLEKKAMIEFGVQKSGL